MKIRIRKIDRSTNFSIAEKLVLFVLFLSFIDVKLYGMHFMVAAFALFCCMKGRVYAPSGVLPMLLMTVSLVLFWDGAFGDSTSMVKCVVWPVAYLLGYGLIKQSAKEENIAEKRVTSLIKLIVFGLLAHYTLNMLVNYGDNALGRNTLDFWSGETRAATGQAALAIIPLGWAVAGIANAESFKSSIGNILVIALILFYNLTLSTRILLLLVPILFAVALIFNMKQQRTAKSKRKILITILVISLAVVVIYAFNLWGVRDIIEDSVLSQRYEVTENMGITDDSRWERKLEYLKLMSTQLLGGGNINAQVGGYAHDVFLDTYDEAGIFSLIAVIAIVWDAISKLRKFIKYADVEHGLKGILLCVYIAILVEFMVEPIIAGIPWMLVLFCFLNGMVTAIVQRKREPELTQ